MSADDEPQLLAGQVWHPAGAGLARTIIAVGDTPDFVIYSTDRGNFEVGAGDFHFWIDHMSASLAPPTVAAAMLEDLVTPFLGQLWPSWDWRWLLTRRSF
jgi:hypothetical protein